MSQLRDKGMTGVGRSSGLTERLARTSALHPWRTIGLWAVLVVLAVLAVGSLLGSGLTSEMKFRAAKPDSLVGQELLAGPYDRARRRSPTSSSCAPPRGPSMTPPSRPT